MKRAVIALVIGAFAFVAVALAAGLTVNDSSLGAGSGNATSCDSAVGTSYVGDTTFSGGSFRSPDTDGAAYLARRPLFTAKSMRTWLVCGSYVNRGCVFDW